MDEPKYTIPAATYNCVFCGKVAPHGNHFCTWECHVESAKAEGGRTIVPNGLPIRAIRSDGTMLEHEHGDHATYLFPVEAERVVESGEPHEWVDGDGNRTPMNEDDVYNTTHQDHALIYCDGGIAVTLYEYCYSMWYVRDGYCGGGSLWKPRQWKLTDESLRTIRKRFGLEEMAERAGESD